jgi:hypothetical protein
MWCRRSNQGARLQGVGGGGGGKVAEYNSTVLRLIGKTGGLTYKVLWWAGALSARSSRGWWLSRTCKALHRCTAYKWTEIQASANHSIQPQVISASAACCKRCCCDIALALPSKFKP